MDRFRAGLRDKGGAAMTMMGRAVWTVRKRFWDRVACAKFTGNRPVTVGSLVNTCRKKETRTVTAIPLNSVFPDISIYNVRLADRVPRDETWPSFLGAIKYAFKWAFFKIQVALYTLFPPMQPGLPSIDTNPSGALHAAYTERHRRAASKAVEAAHARQGLYPPMLPLELQGSVDLGRLAVCGPYAGYLQKVRDDEYQWDLQGLDQYEYRDGVHHLGVRVLFRRDPAMPGLNVCRIESELGTSTPGDATWPLAKKIALCAASTHTTLVRHWNWTHLIAGESISIATRNALPERHPLCRLLWPHVAGTHQSNRFGSMAQLSPKGDYETTFSLSQRGLYRLFDDSYKTYRFSMCDPALDAANRGLRNAGPDLPTQRNLEALFDVMHAHTRHYIGLYYATDADVQHNAPVCRWIEELNRLIPNGVTIPSKPLTCDGVAHVAACLIYLTTAFHEMVGASLWNYQLWPHAQPVRISLDGRRESWDVYQRLINMNYLLQVIRTPLINDFSPLALDEAGRQAFRDFKMQLQSLQHRMEREPWAPWKIYPRDLEANINA
jgi:hypothetical protein